MIINTKKTTEAEIQHDLRSALQNRGYKVYLERNVSLPQMGKTQRTKKTVLMRVDVVVCDHRDKVICFIEVKNHKKVTDVSKTRQYKKYSSSGIPFMFCFNKGCFPRVFDFVNKLTLKHYNS